MNDDLQHLKLLGIFHYIVAAMVALMGCFPLIHFAIGIALIFGHFPDGQHGNPPPEFLGWLFVGVAGIVIVASWAFAIVLLFAAKFLHERRRHTYCLVVAGLECLMMPFGTVLGVFTIIVLLRPSARKLFGEDGETAATGFDG